MADKVNLDIQTILDKEFNIDFKGYSAKEVDSFLDLVIQDYQTYQDTTAELNQKVAELERTNASLRAKLIEMEGKARVAQEGSQAQQGMTNVDLLKRISRLEETIFAQQHGIDGGDNSSR